MLAKLHAFSLLGIEAIPVEVDVDVSVAAMPKTILVGLPEAAVRESTHRVERAIVESCRVCQARTKSCGCVTKVDASAAHQGALRIHMPSTVPDAQPHTPQMVHAPHRERLDP